MDGLCDYKEYLDCIRGLNVVDRCVLAHRPTFGFLNRVVASRASGAPLHIVDVGCGDGDLLRRVQRWARKRNVAVLLTGIDLNPMAIRASRESTSGAGPINYVMADALSWRPEVAIDVVLSSHLTHHLADEDVVRFLRWMEASTRRAWFVSDVHRHRVAYHLFNFLAHSLRWRYVVREDGLRSIRRSFTPREWRKLCDEAGINAADREVRWHAPFRLCVGRMK